MKRLKFFLFAILTLGFSACSKQMPNDGFLRVAAREKFRSIDPAFASESYSQTQVARAYEGLLGYDYEKRPFTLVPLLASALPTVSKDGRVYTFKIRHGVLFQDDAAFAHDSTSIEGRELTAEDFVYSFERIRDPKTHSEAEWIFRDKVKEFKATDRYTLMITLSKPVPHFLHLLALPQASVVAREAVARYGPEFGNHPVGTGPFQLSALRSNQVVWKKNPHYWNKSLPAAEGIIEDIVSEDQTAWLNFLQKSHDYLLKIPKDVGEKVWDRSHTPTKEMRERGIQVLVEPQIGFTYHCFNMEDPVVGGKKNKPLRQAMALAYDVGPVIEKFHLGLAMKAEFLVPPGITGFDPGYRDPNRGYDLGKAREILAKAGHADGRGIPELTYDSLNDATSRQQAEYFARSMAQLGLKVKINSSSWNELTNRIRKKQGQIHSASWLYDYPDAENGLQLLYSQNESPGPNAANYKNPEYDRLYVKVATMADGPERTKLIREMRRIFAEDVPWILSLHRVESRMAHPWISNFRIHPFEYNVEKYITKASQR